MADISICCPLRLILLFVVHVTTVVGSKGSSNGGQFLWLSDIHLDPDYGTPLAAGLEDAGCTTSSSNPMGQLGCDSPYTLVQYIAQHVVDVLEMGSMDFVIVTGDVCRHANDLLEHPIESTGKILSNASDLLLSTLAPLWEEDGPSIIPSLGNNDVTPDYYLDVENPDSLLDMVVDGFSSWLQTEEERTTFRDGGYLSRNISDQLTVLSLNTVLYSKVHNPDQSSIADPLGQFAWLDSQLRLATQSNRSVYIIGHIAPAMGSYRHSQLWHENYSTQYFSLLANHSSKNRVNGKQLVAGQFFGHLHTDEFRLIPAATETFETDEKWPLLMTSSFTPIYGSNPSFRAVSYRRDDGLILDYDTYFLDLLHDTGDGGSNISWDKEPSFCESFGTDEISARSLQGLLDQFNASTYDRAAEKHSDLWETLVARQNVQARDGASSCKDNACRVAWVCTMTTRTTDEFNVCTSQSRTSSDSISKRSLVLVATVGTGTVLTLLAMMWLRRYCQHRHYRAHVNTHADSKESFGKVDLGLGYSSTTSTMAESSSSKHCERLPEIA